MTISHGHVFMVFPFVSENSEKVRGKTTPEVLVLWSQFFTGPHGERLAEICDAAGSGRPGERGVFVSEEISVVQKWCKIMKNAAWNMMFFPFESIFPIEKVTLILLFVCFLVKMMCQK